MSIRHTHGAGDTLAAAIVVGLARGLGVEVAVLAAKRYVAGAIAHGYALGNGIGPVNHGWEIHTAEGPASSHARSWSSTSDPGVAAPVGDTKGLPARLPPRVFASAGLVAVAIFAAAIVLSSKTQLSAKPGQ